MITEIEGDDKGESGEMVVLQIMKYDFDYLSETREKRVF